MGKSAHLILAHPVLDSLNGLLHKTAQEVLQANGFNVISSNLYEMAREKHPALTYYALSDEKGQKKIEEEQQKIKQSALTVVQFPLYWFQFPAVLKTYLEQVWQPGFAYPGTFENSPMAPENKSVLFSITTQSGEAAFNDNSSNGNFSRTLFPMTVAFRFVGFNILKPFILHSVAEKTQQEVGDIVNEYKNYLEKMVKSPEIIMTPGAYEV
jgi:NAD(P)H dehydrogenase (quinone)